MNKTYNHSSGQIVRKRQSGRKGVCCAVRRYGGAWAVFRVDFNRLCAKGFKDDGDFMAAFATETVAEMLAREINRSGHGEEEAEMRDDDHQRRRS